jgi:DNA-binding GntR family transcriptional regulator
MPRTPDAVNRTVTRRNISNQVADIMRDMILVGDLKPGQVVTHEEMSGRLGVSTMPVREALLRLSHEGFIDARQSRSFRVVPTSKRDIEDVYWMHAVLSGELAARAATASATGVADELDGINARWAALPSGATPDLYEDLNWAFHRVVNMAADAPKLLVLLRHTIRFIPDRFYTVLPAWHELSAAGHQEMAEAIRTGEPDRARLAAERHVRAAGDLLIGYFSETGYWQNPNAVDSTAPARQ